MIKEEDLYNYFENEYEVRGFKRYAKLFYDKMYVDDERISKKEIFLLAIYMLCNKNKSSLVASCEVKELFRWLCDIPKHYSNQYFNTYLKENKEDDYIKHDKDKLSLSAKGFKRIKEILSNEFPVKTIIIKAGQYYEGKVKARELVFNNLNGIVRLCDPYIARRTLDLFTETQQKSIEIRILTTNIIDEDVFKRDLNDFQKQHGHKIIVRKTINKELHDRYLIFDSNVISFGTSLKDIGNKDTIISYLPTDIIEGLTELFDNRWNNAQQI